MSRQWFSLDLDAIEKQLETDREEGLVQREVTEKREYYGKNKLPEQEKTPEWLKFIKHFHDVLIYILLVAAVVTFILGHYIDTIVIILVAVINALIGYIQEGKAEKALDGIKNMLSLHATVVRERKRHDIEAEDLVPGDVVLVKAGDKVPADIRLVEADHLKAEEASLTGESTSVKKETMVLDDEAVLGDRVNMLFSGTSLSQGTGRGIVVATGENTEIGQINQSMQDVEEIKTPLLKQTNDFGKLISVVIVILAVVLFGFGLVFHQYDWQELLLSVIGLMVAAIPEGLPAILSIILALGVQSMADNKAIMRTLPSVETLGAVTVICSDKTGTLTKNEMTVTTVVTEDNQFDVSGTGYEPTGELRHKDAKIAVADYPALLSFLTAVKTVNESDVIEKDNQWIVQGEPTEGCLVTLADKADQHIKKLTMQSKIPFDSSYKYMAALVEEEGEKKIYLKGAPDRVFDMAGLKEGSDERNYWEQQMKERTARGERVIAAAVKVVNKETEAIGHENVTEGMTLLGLAGIIDPPREEAIEAIKACKQAGITVKMITGDHKDTALAIAKQMDLTGRDVVVEGRDLDAMTDEERCEIVRQVDVFARTSPKNKLQLVEALQTNGEISAMTGDGVNDAPALKRADIGVAMGIKGTEVAKEASEMVLVDDNFKTIVNAVKEGRRVYDNLKKTILFILPTNGAEAFLVMAALLLGITMPLSAVQILYVNMVTAVTVALALAFEPIERGTMEKPPRKSTERLLSPYYMFRIVFVALLIGGSILLLYPHWIEQYGQENVSTITLHALVFAQLFHMFNVRNERHISINKDFFKNKAAFIVSAILIIVQLLVTYVPFMQVALDLRPISVQEWFYPVIIGLGVFVIVEIEKLLTHRVFKRQ
ncbi:plasma-membrane calcium-translocating P-type ATPase/potassium and/or sodium efflux P-type ATPase,TIGR01523 [Halolactibacillus halophilus]|uniref:Carbonate dehydratase n=1 Tax=Halolactibacillus halophilus TaxID=306540 RepID=A0A1I5LV80_9BACI|nr:HAD-IC family P-type ATPase [Halolactibacillus halophilus]GEM00893.1 carbonate dehydratase [Halolactibacillus halophilus]SFP01238.1 plasma-membrane calcium-translocating P-type ATPase/potassium and/or sodium efflux P-type ATPase,TIGR01523 [Halolactibacillus halophilus]